MKWPVLVLFVAGCQLGRPPARSYIPGSVYTTSPQLGLAAAIRESLADELAQRGGLGEGATVQIRVLDAEAAVQATQGDVQLHQARLVLQVQTAGTQPREVILRGARTYTISASAPLSAAAARTAATEALARELVQDVVEWLMYAETP